MKKMLLAFTFLFLLFQTNIYATHVMGGDITYTCVGGNTYEIQLSVFRDCNGITLGNQATINLTSPSCGGTTVTVNLIAGSPTIVTPICSTEPDKCNGVAGVYGVQKYVYKTNLTLVGCWAQASDIRMSWNLCCTNNAITTIGSSVSSYFYADLNATTNCNNSPQFLNDPLFFAGVNSLTNYTDGGFDADGDSLVFTLTDCLQAAGSPVPYMPPFNGQNPLTTTSGISINSQTGEMVFTPTTIQVGIICLVIEEFRNGVKIGETSRNIQIGVLPVAANNAPILSGINGTASASGTTGVTNISGGCNIDTISFTITAFDADTGQTISWETLTIPNGATFTPGANNTGTFLWIPAPSDFGKNHAFALKAWDNACPVRKHDMKVYSMDLKAIASTAITASANYANVGDTIYLQTSLPDTSCSATWTGSSLLSCTNCPDPYFIADSTATFNSTVNCAFGCSYTDQVTINVNQQVTGTITTSFGAPLANSTVNIYNTNNQLLQTTTTDANGNYLFNLVASNIIVEAIPDSVVYSSELTTSYQGGAAVMLYAQNNINFSTNKVPNIITGIISTKNGLPLDSSIVMVLDTGYNVIATLPTDANGYYSYSTSEAAVYLVAVPDSIQHPNQLATYYFGAVVIQNATLITLQPTNSINFNTVQLALKVGSNGNVNNLIAGVLLEGAESGGPLADIKLLLMNENNEPVDVGYTTTDGLFMFEDLDTGVYQIWVDEVGIDNELTGNIPVLLNNTTLILDSLTCYLHSYYLEVEIPTTIVSTNNQLEVSQMTIQPNPATADVYLDIELEQPTQANISIFNLSGQLIGQVFEGKLQAGMQRYELSSTLQTFNGICIIKFQTKTGVISKRLLYLK